MRLQRYQSFVKILENSNGEKLYHGNRKGDFPPEKRRFAGAIFLTSNLAFARDFAGFDESDQFPDGAVFEVTLKPGLKICDLMEPKVMVELGLEDLIKHMVDQGYVDPTSGTKFNKITGKGFKGFDPATGKVFDIDEPHQSANHYLWRVKNGAWRVIECEPVVRRIREKGYDGFSVMERGSRNVAIFDEASIQSYNKIK